MIIAILAFVLGMNAYTLWRLVELRARVEELESVELSIDLGPADDSPRQMMRDLNDLRRRLSRHTGSGR